jgi:hypothetical protein
VVVEGDLAWFDEHLVNDKYGDCRGTGVPSPARQGSGSSPTTALTFLIPNERARAVIELVRGKS